MADIEDTLMQLVDAGDVQDGVNLCRSMSRKPRSPEDRENMRAAARKLLERFPDDPGLHIAVAAMLLRSGNLTDAHEQLRQMKRGFPDEERIHELLGEVLLRMGDARGAVVAFERALTLNADVAVEEVLTEARVLTRAQDARGAEAVAREARMILGEPAEPLAVRRRGLSEIKTPIVHDVRAMVDGLSHSSAPPRPLASARPPGRGRAGTSFPPPGMRGSDASLRPRAAPHASAAPQAGSLGTSRGGSVAPRGPLPSIPPAEMPHVSAKEEETAISRRTWIVGGVGLLAALATGGLVASRWGEGRGFDRALVDLAIAAMLTARPTELDRATALSRRVLAQAPRSSEAGVRAMQAAVLGVLDGRESPGGLDAAVEDARARGALAEEVAPGEALSLLLRGQVAEAKTRLATTQPREQPIDAVVLHVVRGVVLERASDAAARESYEAAVKAEPRAVAALLRLGRMLIAEGDGEAASATLQRIAALGEDRRPLVVDLESIARHAGVPLLAAADASPPPKHLGDDLPRALRASGIAVEAAGAGDDAEASARMGAAVLAAETASDAALVGRIALRRGALGAVSFAVHRATELGAGDARGAFLAAQLAYARGDLARVEELHKRLPERAAAACAGLLAYERGDLPALAAAAPRAASVLSGALKLGTVRLGGARPLESAELARLTDLEGPAGELIAVDAWLDRGTDVDLEAAAAITLSWPREGRGALRALRIARLLRLRGDRAGAHEALGDAAELPTAQAAIETLLDRDKARVAVVRARLDAALEAARPWLGALERVASRDDAGAKKLIADASVPGPESGLVVRTAAALALSATGDKRSKALVKEITAVFPDGRDLQRERRAGGGGKAAPAAGSGDTYD